LTVGRQADAIAVNVHLMPLRKPLGHSEQRKIKALSHKNHPLALVDVFQLHGQEAFKGFELLIREWSSPSSPKNSCGLLLMNSCRS
jgi:hypothetical protein